MVLRIYALYQRKLIVLCTVGIFGLYSTAVLAVSDIVPWSMTCTNLVLIVYVHTCKRKYVAFNMNASTPTLVQVTSQGELIPFGPRTAAENCLNYIDNMWVHNINHA